MYRTNWIYEYLSQIDKYVRAQQQQITNLENETKRLQAELKSMQNQIDGFKDKPATTIERIEYKFDQLKIERLEGTLNIGLTPNGTTEPEEFGDFSVNQTQPTSMKFTQNDPNFYSEINEHIQRYLKEECPAIFREKANKQNLQLDESQLEFILQDINQQLEKRIQYYVNQLGQQVERTNNLEDLQYQVANQIKIDIENAIDSFIRNFPKGGHF